MADTKENILLTALRLFAADGYEAVSVSTIAGALGIAKSALYKHYKNKRAIFDSIVQRMREMDAERASAYEVPEGTLEEMAEAYQQTQFEKIREFSKAQFRYWTEDAFASCFRKMLTLEQYRSPEMSQLFQQYLASGPMEYLKDLFSSMLGDQAEAAQLAVRFYAPMFFLYSVYDGTENQKAVSEMLFQHLDEFTREWMQRRPLS